MFEEVKNYCNEINEILQELENYENYKEKLEKDLAILEKRYQTGKYGYEQYKQLKTRILSGKTKEALHMYYNAYILTLIKRIDVLNTQIFSKVYGMPSEPEPVSDKFAESISKPERKKQRESKQKEELVKIPFAAKTGKIKPKKIKELHETEPVQKLEAKDKVSKEKIHEGKNLEAQIEVPKPLPKRKLEIPKPKYSPFAFLAGKKKSLFEEILEKENIKEEPIKVSGVMNLDLIKNLRKRLKDKSKFIGEKTEVKPSILKLRKKAEEELDIESPTLMAEQAEKIRNILVKKKVKIYTPSSIGFIANLTVRRLVLILMNHFPDFFKQLYLNLRYANIKLLSNTYVNIMFFTTLLLFLFSFPISLIVFGLQSTPFFIDFTKALLFSLILSSVCFSVFYLSPNFKIKKRVRSINTNLPFAIDHMSSVAASGVPPATMFKLIANSKEYEEVSKEIEKISNYIEIFGYDLITSIKSVSATTPNKQLKEFFDGLVSTIESGGDIKNYLSQRSKEALLTYRLERQKYVEAISTYSDIYTGVLIAAPLFFVSTLTLVSMLGGAIGGFNISTIIAVGTYLVIPLLNVLFLVFLEVNQPQI